MRGLLLFYLDDVVAVLRANEPGGLSRLQREGSLVELGDGRAVLEEAELAALLLAAGIVGVLLRQLGEVAAVVELIENVLGLGLGGGVSLGVVAVDLDEDVADLDLVVDLVVLQVLVVVLLNFGVGDLRSALGEIGVGEGDVLILRASGTAFA